MKIAQVNSLWIGDRLSTLERLAITSHLQQGHHYNLWTYGPVANVPDGATVCNGPEILPANEIFAYHVGEGAGSVSAFSNLFRYKLLAERGGWWVDTDVVALKPFRFEESLVFASERNRNGSSSPTTCAIYCEGPNNILGDCYKLCKHLKDVSEAKLKWGSLGPNLLCHVVFGRGVGEYAVSPETFCPVNWFDAEFDPVVHNSPDLSGSHAVHLWHEMWRRRGIDKDGNYDKNCLFERLKHDILRATSED